MDQIIDDLVTVIIPFYNETDYFHKCIDSVFNQTYKKLEIIIVDDGSNLKSKKELLKLKDLNLSNLKIIEHEHNKGVSASRNTGIKFSTGSYIAFIDADDEWMPNKIEYQLNIIKNKKLNYLHNSYYVIDENENFKGMLLAKNMNYNKLIKSCDIGLSTVIIKSDLCKKIKFQNISTKEDYVFWLSLSKIVPILPGNPEILSIYRKRKKSLSNSLITKFFNAFKVYNKYEGKNFIISILLVLRLSVYWVFKQKNSIQKNIYPISLRYTKKLDKLDFKNSFILVALNLASLAYLKILFINYKNILFWLDGYTAKYVVKNFDKLPGREVINRIKIPDHIKNIYLCGNKSDKQIEYLEKKLDKKILFKEVPFLKNNKDVANFTLQILDNSAVIVNISSPKQEILAQNILKNNPNKKIFIFCLGGGIAMACGEEKKAPQRIEELNLEWLWRLQSNTIHRLNRLIYTSFLFLFRKVTNFYNKIIFVDISR